MSNHNKNVFWIALETIILAAFVFPMFRLNFVTGILYVVAIIIAFWKGFIFKRKWVSVMIVFGTILSYFVGAYLLPMAVGNYIAGDITSAAIIGVLIIYLWLTARNLKRGK